MICNRPFVHSLWRAGLAALAAGALVPLAVAHDEPNGNAAQNQSESNMETQAPPGATEFILDQQSDVEQLNYAQPQRLRICNRSGEGAATPVPVAYPLLNPEPLTERPVPIHQPTAVALWVTYDGRDTAVEPGRCVRVHARHLRIRAGQGLPAQTILTGWIEPLNANSQTARNGGNVADERATLVQLREELAQDDRQMRAATAELNHARQELEQAAHQMRAEQAHNASTAPLRQANSGNGAAQQ